MYPSFVGRQAELVELQHTVDALLSGQGGVVVLEGEPGIGKTRLAREFAADASSRGVCVLWETCRDGGDTPQLWPWIQMIHRQSLEAGFRKPILTEGSNWPMQSAVSRSVKILTDEVDGATPARLEQFAEAAFSMVANRARSDPLAIVFEDAEQADQHSLELLSAVARDLRQVLIILTCNAAALATVPQLRDAFAHKLLNGARRLRLRPFHGSEFVQLVQTFAGFSPDADTMRRLEQMSGGNPWFVELIVGSGLTRLRDASECAHLTPMLRMAADLYLRTLSEHSRLLLTLAAMIGPTFEMRILEELSDDPREEVADAVWEAQAAGVITPIEGRPASYGFIHHIVRQALYENVPKSQAMRLHQRIGQALHDLHGFQHEYLSQIATHFFQGRPEDGTDPKPAEYCRRAAEYVESLPDFPEAMRFYRMGLASLQPDVIGVDGWRCDLLLALARVQNRSGDVSAASNTAMHAAELAESNQDPVRYARAVLASAGNIWRLGFGALDAPRVGVLLEKSLQMFGNSTEPAAALVSIRLAAGLFLRGQSPERQRALLERATAIAQRSNDPESLLSVLHYRRLALLSQPAGCSERLSGLEKMLSAASSLNRSEEWCTVFISRQLELLRTGDLMRAELGVADLADAAHRTGETVFAQTLILWSAMRALIDGRFDEALSIAWRFLDLAEKILPDVVIALFLPSAVTMSRELGRLGEVEAIAERGVQSHPWLVVLQAILAQIRFGLGDVDGSRCILRALLSQGFAGLDRYASMTIYLAILAELSAELGEQSHAGELYARLLPYQSENVVLGPIGFAGPAARYLGLLANMQRRFDDAERHFSEAARLSTRTGTRPWMAYTEIGHAHMLLNRNRCGDRERALGLIASALNTARALGMNDLVRRAEALKKRLESGQEEMPVAQGLGQTGLAIEYSEHAIERLQPERPQAQLTASATEVVADEPVDAAVRLNGARQPQANIFKREGDYWTIVFNGKTTRLKHAKGVSMIAWLLRHPRRDFLALALERLAAGGPCPSTEAADGRFARELPSRAEADDSGPRLDLQARTAYQQRLEELHTGLAEAKVFNDIGRVSELEQEINFLESELCLGVGFRGRARKWPSEIERSRINVTNAVRSVVAKLRTQNSELARYLSNTIRTGRFCSFEPDPLVPADWIV